MQRLHAPEFGDVDVDSLRFTSFPGGETRFIIEQTKGINKLATQNSVLSHEDIDWMETIFRAAAEVSPPRPTYVHVDFKIGNLCVEKMNGDYRVSGLFDFHEGRFGNGAVDLVRQGCSFIDHSIDLAQAFVQSLIAHAGYDPRVKPLMRLFLINDRMKIWGYFSQPGVKSPLPVAGGFKRWAERHFDANVFW